ncbi:MAG: glycosyltransferase family 39 protein [Armatimonadetes bacterium]|nr:glycosyltransferase family 39 protein [Armatimonadota bacterium]
MGGRIKGFENFAFIGLFVVGFIFLLSYYGYALLPFWPDETFFLQPAQNLAEGKGMGTPALDDLLPGISQRTYWQPPVYFLALSVWGKFMGFNVMSSRCFSRACAIGVLVLLWFLARRWGIGERLALFCVIWTGLDLTFQYNANLGRMDTLNAFLLMGSLVAFTSYQQNGREWHVGMAGVFGSLATLTHFIAIPAVLTLGAILVWRRQVKALVWFALPILVGWVLWLTYAAQDWQSYFGQLELQFVRKGEGGLSATLLRLFFPQSLVSLYGTFPINSPPIWFILLALTFGAWLRGSSPLKGWQIALFSMAFLSAASGGELWYIGWWIPFGYLLLSLWLQFILEHFPKKAWIWTLCILWVCWQLFKIGQAVSSVPELKRDIDRFFVEVSEILPHGAKVILHCVPDPFPLLQSDRPDLQLIQISPTPMLPEALNRVQKDSDFFVGLTNWAEGRGLNLPEFWKEWRFRGPESSWGVKIHKLRKDDSRLPQSNKNFKSAHNVNCDVETQIKLESGENEG